MVDIFTLFQKAISPLSIDCIIAYPSHFSISFPSNPNLDYTNLFAIGYYQQPQLTGGIALYSPPNSLPTEKDIFAIGPVLHIAWIDTNTLCCATRQKGIFIVSTLMHVIAHIPISGFNLYVHFQPYHKIFQITANNTNLATNEDNNFFMNKQEDKHQQQYKTIGQMLVSTDKSSVYEYELDKQYNAILTNKYQKHEYAVWSCHKWGNDMICGDEVGTVYQYHKGMLKHKNQNAHTGGICHVTSQGALLYTGGFDGRLCVYNNQDITTSLNTFHIGGIVWRIIPILKTNLLLVCLSDTNTIKVIQPQGNAVWSSQQNHSSLAYAADCNTHFLLTASFYDKKINIWKVNLLTYQK